MINDGILVWIIDLAASLCDSFLWFGEERRREGNGVFPYKCPEDGHVDGERARGCLRWASAKTYSAMGRNRTNVRRKVIIFIQQVPSVLNVLLTRKV